MPKVLAEDLEDRVIKELARHAAGVSASDLAKRFASQASERSIRRIIKRLERRRAITVTGRARSTKYLLRDIPVAPPELRSVAPAAAEPYVPLSPDGEMIRNWVRLPVTQRRPVGYQRGFLDAYKPNETFYLGDEERRTWLHQTGALPGGRPAGTYARDILDRLLIDLSWASSKLEGNTYTRLDTEQLIEHGKAAEGKDRTETQMILNHKQAIEFLIDQAAQIGFNRYTILNLHTLLSENLLADPNASGRIRARLVNIHGTVFQPLGIPQRLEELFDLVLAKADAIEDPFEQAFFSMVHLPYLQPFEDVNKRVSRLAANIPLIRHGLSPLSFIDVPERAYVEGLLGVYERNQFELLRDVFYWAYERSCQQFQITAASLPAPDPFRLQYRNELGEAVRAVIDRGWHPDIDPLHPIVDALVPAKDQRRFTDMLLAELRGLHEGNIARYRVSLPHFRAWKQEQG